MTPASPRIVSVRRCGPSKWSVSWLFTFDGELHQRSADATSPAQLRRILRDNVGREDFEAIVADVLRKRHPPPAKAAPNLRRYDF